MLQKHLTKILLTTGFSLVLLGCDPGTPEDDKPEDSIINPSGYAKALSTSEYNSLSNVEKYQVANKLLGTMYKGMPVSKFFDLSKGSINNLKLRSTAKDLLEDIRQDVLTPLPNSEKFDIDNDVETDYSYTDSKAKELPMAKIFEYPISKESFDHWIAYVLTNTILFSPAEEIDSANITDVESVYEDLVADLRYNRSVRQIIARHQNSLENWRRFRSPEDNTREMIEIYMGLFDRDEDVPRAAIACQDLYLTDEDDGYRLVSNGNINSQPQQIFRDLDRRSGTSDDDVYVYVTTCNDFYDAVANHPLVIPRVITVLVEYFFQGRSTSDRARLIQSIANSNPETFQDIFGAIIFSRQYLLRTERPKSFEEAFYSISKQIKWVPRDDIWRGMASGSGNASRTEMQEMGWPSMYLKLGRLAGIPQDAYSFANFHKGLRELLLVDFGQWRDTLIGNRALQMNTNDFIDFIFLSGGLRKATTVERADLITLFDNVGYVSATDSQVINNGRHDDAARAILDYISRLPETYYFNRIN